MKPRTLQSTCRRKLFHGVIAIFFLGLLTPVHSQTPAQQVQSQEMTTTTSDSADTEQAPKLPNDQLDSLVAPIALYPDPLLAQTLAASTYPLEVIQLEQWMEKNPNLKGKALADAVAKQPWDPSIQALVEFPDVVQRMAGNIQWTTDLGNAFLAQESDVMDAAQRMRAKAQGTGNLKTSAQSVVKTETVPSGKQVIAIQQANPDVVYVPSYDPAVVYGPPPPQYPYYPYTYPGYVPGTALAWGAGIALGAAAWGAWGGGGWGWNCGWGGGNVNVNVNNKYVNNYNKNVNKNFNQGNFNKQGGTWQHNAQHRGNAPYGNRQTANKYGGGGARGQGGAGGAGARLAELELVQVAVLELVIGLAVVPELETAQVAALELVIDQAAVPELVIGLAVVLELVIGPVVAAELQLVQVVAELEHVQGEAALELVRAAVPLRTRSVTAAHRRDLVPRLAAEDLAAEVETTREPAAAEAVIAWEVAE